MIKQEQLVFSEDGDIGFSVLIEVRGGEGPAALEGLEVTVGPCFGKAGGITLESDSEGIGFSGEGDIGVAIAIKISGHEGKVPLVRREGDFLEAGVFDLRFPAVPGDGPLAGGDGGAAGDALVEQDQLGILVIDQSHILLAVPVKIRRNHTAGIPGEAGYLRPFQPDRCGGGLRRKEGGEADEAENEAHGGNPGLNNLLQ